MLGRSITWVGLCCLALCACGKPKDKASEDAACNADGGCADAEVLLGGSQGAAASEAMAAAGSGARRTRVQAASGETGFGDAGLSTPDAEAASSSAPSRSRGEAGAGDSTRTSRAGAAAPMMEPEPSAEEPEPDAEEPEPEPESMGEEPVDAGAPSAECDEQSCGPCEACGESGSCEPVTGRDDADSCSDSRSCSSKGTCLHVSESQADLGTMSEYAELTTGYAQVVTFREPATIVEIRLEVSCNENDQTFPAAWLVNAPGGIPTNTIIATANVLYQAPSDTNTFAVLELSRELPQPQTGPIAIVVSRTDMGCIIRLNTEEPYEGGSLFSQGTSADLWLPAEGSMVFQVLSSR